MDLVIDANVLFSALIKKGKTEELLFDEDLHLFAPEFIFEEFSKYSDLILEKTERTKEEFDELIMILKKRVKTIPNEATDKFVFEAQKISPDIKDADYFALALNVANSTSVVFTGGNIVMEFAIMSRTTGHFIVCPGVKRIAECGIAITGGS